MAKRELSSTLRNLKFMQRASLREEKPKKKKKMKKENGTSQCGLENSDLNDWDHDPDEDFKFKQDDTSSEAQYSNKSHKRGLDDPVSSPSSSQRSKKPHRLDWSVLKPPRSQKRRR
ncbi:hypothetical protein RND71_018999 [Anisodus tanguticus]|uniref:Uncharacterized protein n=1 Tax=Anisodus tanguticus TaxID=243964 RepID=A0AAE1VBI2_9SOLA|nr:hypothetical protein RND71_018999 [Anisodus tanguticus]